MKTIKIYTSIALAALLAVSVVSCKKDFYAKANKNPNSPANVPPGILLTNVEVSLAYTQGGDLSRFASMFDQQTFGASRQAQAYYQYIFTNQDVDNTWANIYTSVMENDMALMKQADAAGNNVYSGIARVLMAYTLQITVDFWGYIPYSQALLGLGNTKPSYDADNTLYNTTILQMLNDGIAKLSNSNPGVLVPGADDVVGPQGSGYAGSATEWIKFAHALKARIFIHQTKSGSNVIAMADSALAEVNSSFTSNSDNAEVYFGPSFSNNSPWFQFNNQRDDISFEHATLADSLITQNDPRYPFYIDSASENNPSIGIGLASYFGSSTSPVEFITYDELQFIAAEATLKSGGTVAAALVLYQNGITANMNKLGVPSGSISSYLLGPQGILPLTAPAAIARIGYQEWLSLYLNPEAWSTWRRINSPNLTPVIGTAIPRRMVYPQTEISLNGNSYNSAATLYSPKVFWDN